MPCDVELELVFVPVGSAARGGLPANAKQVRTVITDQGDTVRGEAHRPLFEFDEVFGYQPHWASCPQAQEFKGGKR